MHFDYIVVDICDKSEDDDNRVEQYGKCDDWESDASE